MSIWYTMGFVAAAACSVGVATGLMPSSAAWEAILWGFLALSNFVKALEHA